MVFAWLSRPVELTEIEAGGTCGFGCGEFSFRFGQGGAAQVSAKSRGVRNLAGERWLTNTLPVADLWGWSVREGLDLARVRALTEGGTSRQEQKRNDPDCRPSGHRAATESLSCLCILRAISFGKNPETTWRSLRRHPKAKTPFQLDLSPRKGRILQTNGQDVRGKRQTLHP